MTDDRASEHITVLRCQLGDQASFEKLYDRYNDRLLYYLRRLLQGSGNAEDVLQEVWLTVFRRVHTLQNPSAFRAWLFRIGHNCAVSVLRQSGRPASFDDELDDEGVAAAAIEEGHDSGGLREADAALIHAGLGRIGAKQREVLTLRFLGDLSYAEIVDVVGSPLGTVKSRIYHAKRALRREIEALKGPAAATVPSQRSEGPEPNRTSSSPACGGNHE